MKYTLKFLHPSEQLITVCIETTTRQASTYFYLPKWRPGRYQLQNHAQYISDVRATQATGELLFIQKKSTHVWEVQAEAGTKINLTYVYYANQVDAGGSWFDHEQIYVNGINLFMYQKEGIDEKCELQLELPSDYQLAIGLKNEGGSYHTHSFHQLVDSPFFASRDLLHHLFEVQGIPMHLWFQGICKPDLHRMEQDIGAYTKAQLALFGDFPVSEYHYFVRLLPYAYRHGVEHYNSTVIVMGPGHQLMHPQKYKSFLEICSHELFHTWNVKCLRPTDMFPYSYEGENYSRLHYITEGLTTYYGDLMIWKGGQWNLRQWLDSINGELVNHYQKGGKDYVSLEEASFNSWTDGYQKPGTPNRKISFYTKGYLVSMLIDFEIRRATEDQYSLDQVIYQMYQSIAKAGRGYTREDYQSIIEAVSAKPFEDFFEKYISGSEDLEHKLAEMAAYYGFELYHHAYRTMAETWLGLRGMVSADGTYIEHLMPNCPALVAGMSLGDELISLNGQKIEKNLEDLLFFFRDEKLWEFHYFHEKQLKMAQIVNDGNYKAYIPQFRLAANGEAEKVERIKAWQSVRVREQLLDV